MDVNLALQACELGLEPGLPVANSVTLATARLDDADLWTQDTDFQEMAGVKSKAKGKTWVNLDSRSGLASLCGALRGLTPATTLFAIPNQS